MAAHMKVRFPYSVSSRTRSQLSQLHTCVSEFSVAQQQYLEILYKPS